MSLRILKSSMCALSAEKRFTHTQNETALAKNLF